MIVSLLLTACLLTRAPAHSCSPAARQRFRSPGVRYPSHCIRRKVHVAPSRPVSPLLSAPSGTLATARSGRARRTVSDSMPIGAANAI